MSQQVMEKLIYEWETYDITAIENFDDFHLPETLRMPFHAPHTGCNRGFETEYAVDNSGKLVVHNFTAWTPKEGAECHLWGGDLTEINIRNVDIPVPYSGFMLVGRECLGFWMEGYAPPMAYQTLLKLTFEDGKLISCEDYSQEAAKKREELSKNLEDPLAVPRVSHNMYSLDYADKWDCSVYHLPEWINNMYYLPVFILADVTPSEQDEHVRNRTRDLIAYAEAWVRDYIRCRDLFIEIQGNLEVYFHVVEYTSNAVLDNSHRRDTFNIQEYHAENPGLEAALEVMKQCMENPGKGIMDTEKPAENLRPIVIWAYRDLPAQGWKPLPEEIAGFPEPCKCFAWSMTNQMPAEDFISESGIPQNHWMPACTVDELGKAFEVLTEFPFFPEYYRLQEILGKKYEEQIEDDHWGNSGLNWGLDDIPVIPEPAISAENCDADCGDVCEDWVW